MKKYDTFPSWAADQLPKHKRTISFIRKFVKKVAPSLTESVKWGNGVWLGQEWPVLFLHAKDDHLQFGFFGGSGLSDPKKLLVGSGKYIKHVKVYKLSEFDETALKQLIREAEKAEKE